MTPARTHAQDILDTMRAMLGALDSKERAAVEEHVLRHCWGVYNRRKRKKTPIDGYQPTHGGPLVNPPKGRSGL